MWYQQEITGMMGLRPLASNPDAITVSAIADSDGKCGRLGPALKSENSTDDTFAYFSNFGPSVTIAAPGVSILSTFLDGEYAIDSGTSMASPSVAGAADLIKADAPQFAPKDVKEALLETGSTPLTPCQGGQKGISLEILTIIRNHCFIDNLMLNDQCIPSPSLDFKTKG